MESQMLGKIPEECEMRCLGLSKANYIRETIKVIGIDISDAKKIYKSVRKNFNDEEWRLTGENFIHIGDYLRGLKVYAEAREVIDRGFITPETEDKVGVLFLGCINGREKLARLNYGIRRHILGIRELYNGIKPILEKYDPAISTPS
ncbi:MAG: hypothetical protein V1648_00950 [Candidatus Aenigmatarchaeota archaeon]